VPAVTPPVRLRDGNDEAQAIVFDQAHHGVDGLVRRSDQRARCTLRSVTMPPVAPSLSDSLDIANQLNA
jgi:hypothetical protein